MVGVVGWITKLFKAKKCCRFAIFQLGTGGYPGYPWQCQRSKLRPSWTTDGWTRHEWVPRHLRLHGSGCPKIGITVLICIVCSAEKAIWHTVLKKKVTERPCTYSLHDWLLWNIMFDHLLTTSRIGNATISGHILQFNSSKAMPSTARCAVGQRQQWSILNDWSRYSTKFGWWVGEGFDCAMWLIV